MESKIKGTKKRVCAKCGGIEFSAYQKAQFGCVVNGEGKMHRLLPWNQTLTEAIHKSGQLSGPFECMECGNRGDTLETITVETEFKPIVISLFEKQGDSGLSRDEISEILDDLNSYYVFPVELFSKQYESSAIGFLTPECAEYLEYDYDELETYIASIIDDMTLEHENGIYDFRGLSIKLRR